MLEEKEKYSHSKIKLYEHCPYDYYLRYELKVEPIKKSHHLILGLALHKLNEQRIHNNIDFPSARQFLKNYVSANPANKPPGEIYKLAEKMARSLLKSPDNSKYPIVATEERFEFDLGDFIVRGFIDGRTADDHIYEYKTSGRKYTVPLIKESWQWVLYRLGFEQITGRTPKGVIYHVSYKSGANPGVEYLDPILISDADVERAKQWILKNVIEIRKGNFEASRYNCGPKDPICDYKDLCLKS